MYPSLQNRYLPWLAFLICTASPPAPLLAQRPGQEETFHRITFCYCPPGELLLVEPSNPSRYADETRLIARGFWIAKTELSQGDYRRIEQRSHELRSKDGVQVGFTLPSITDLRNRGELGLFHDLISTSGSTDRYPVFALTAADAVQVAVVLTLSVTVHDD